MFGKLHSNDNINYQAFPNTMKEDWKVEPVTFVQLDAGVLFFTFKTETDKERVLENNPWSFASNLLILHPKGSNSLAVFSGFKSMVFPLNGIMRKSSPMLL